MSPTISCKCNVSGGNDDGDDGDDDDHVGLSGFTC